MQEGPEITAAHAASRSGARNSGLSASANGTSDSGNQAETTKSRPVRPSASGSVASTLRASSRLERKAIAWAYQRVGRPRVCLVLWDGTAIGDQQSAVGQLVIQHPSTLRRLFWNPNLAFGECYSDGSLLIRGDILTVLLEVNRGLTRARQQGTIPAD